MIEQNDEQNDEHWLMKDARYDDTLLLSFKFLTSNGIYYY